MRVSDTEAAQRVADNDNLVGELVGILKRLHEIAPLSAVLYSIRDEIKSLIDKAEAQQ